MRKFVGFFFLVILFSRYIEYLEIVDGKMVRGKKDEEKGNQL